VPVLFVESHTFDTVQSVNELYGRIEPTDTKRIATALAWFAKLCHSPELTKRVVSQRSTKITPAHVRIFPGWKRRPATGSTSSCPEGTVSASSTPPTSSSAGASPTSPSWQTRRDPGQGVQAQHQH